MSSAVNVTLAGAVLLTTLAGCDSQHTASTTGRWRALFSQAPSLDGSVHAIRVSPSGEVYVGGTFVAAGSDTLNRIAVWNGTGWQALGRGVSALVDAIAISEDEDVLVGGWFSFAGSKEISALARWSGSEWQPLGEGLFNAFPAITAVYAIELDAAQNAYVGGDFTHAGGAKANAIAVWNGSTWHSLGEGVSGQGFFDTLINQVLALTTGTNEVFVGGRFTEAGGQPANRIAAWSEQGWRALGEGVAYPDAEHLTLVLSIAIDEEGRLYAAGRFTRAGRRAVNNIAVWTGESWAGLGSGVDDTVHALAIDSRGNLFAGGEFTEAGGKPARGIAMWDGTVWRTLDGGVDGNVYALDLDESGNLYVGGKFSRAGGLPATNIALWDALGD